VKGGGDGVGYSIAKKERNHSTHEICTVSCRAPFCGENIRIQPPIGGFSIVVTLIKVTDEPEGTGFTGFFNEAQWGGL